MGLLRLFCHQKKERCFTINNFVFPICSRCTGIYTGIILGFLFLGGLFFDLFEYNKIITIILFLLSIIPLGVDGTGQLLGKWQSNNYIRFLTGILTGLTTGGLIYILIKLYI